MIEGRSCTHTTAAKLVHTSESATVWPSFAVFFFATPTTTSSTSKSVARNSREARAGVGPSTVPARP